MTAVMIVASWRSKSRP